MRELRQPIAIVCHDAGGANVIQAAMRANPGLAYLPVMRGPASAIWRAAPPITDELLSLDDAMTTAGSVLTGTGWASDLEHQARVAARDKGIHSVAVIDHWVNYAERFKRAGITVLPDEMWVTDDYAQSLATAQFPSTTVRRKPNHYLDEMIRSIGPPPAKRSETHILYALEPIRYTWPGATLAGEFEALNYFADNLHRLSSALEISNNSRSSFQLRLRPHPSDATGKYDAWIAAHSDLNAQLDVVASVVEAIQWADWVVGCETMALVVALHTQRRVASTLPPSAPKCRLPHTNIVHLRDLP